MAAIKNNQECTRGGRFVEKWGEVFYRKRKFSGFNKIQRFIEELQEKGGFLSGAAARTGELKK